MEYDYDIVEEPPLRKRADVLSREELASELRQRASRQVGILGEDRATLQVFYDEQYDREYKAYTERQKEKEKQLIDNQSSLRVRHQTAKRRLEEIQLLKEKPEVQKFVDCMKVSKRNLDAIFHGATPALLRILDKGLREQNNCASLVSLDLSHGQFGLHALEALASILENTNSVQKIEIENSNIGPRVFGKLGEVLLSNTSVKQLSLENNPITEDGREFSGIQAFGRAIAKNQHLVALNLRRTQLGPKGCAILSKEIEENTTLRIIDVDFPDVGVRELKKLVSVLDRNKARFEKKEQAEHAHALYEFKMKERSLKLKKEEADRLAFKAKIEREANERMEMRFAEYHKEKEEKNKSLEEAAEKAKKRQIEYFEALEASRQKAKGKK